MNPDIAQLEERISELETKLNKIIRVGKYLFPNDIEMFNGKNFIFSTGDGTKIGTATTQKLGFYNATPVVQPTSGNQAVVSLTTDVSGSNTVNKTAINTNFSNIQTLLNQLRNDLVSVGLIKGS